MAESADILTGAGAEGDPARPRRRLLDGRHGPARPGRGRLGRAGRRRRRRRRRTRHLHELLGRHQGVLRPPRRRGLHLVQRPGRARVGLRSRRARTPRSSSCPTSTSAATPPCCSWASPSTTAWSGTRCCPAAGCTDEQLRDARMILWKGHCSVHGRFSADVVDELRATIPGVQILVHPECQHEVVLKADLVGSTEFIIKTIEAAPAGSSLGDRHRAQPGQAARRRPPRQEDRRSSTAPSATARR